MVQGIWSLYGGSRSHSSTFCISSSFDNFRELCPNRPSNFLVAHSLVGGLADLHAIRQDHFGVVGFGAVKVGHHDVESVLRIQVRHETFFGLADAVNAIHGLLVCEWVKPPVTK